MSKATTAQKLIYFSKFVVNDEVFFQSKHTYALVNLKPIVPGHVLVVPLRVVSRLKDLTTEESIDYMLTLQKIHKFIEYIYKADSLNIAIQDGPEAGQSVPHLHTHVIPRYRENNYGDKVYDYLNDVDIELDFQERKKQYKNNGGDTVKPDDERIERTPEVMLKEALWLKEELEKFEQ